MYTTIIENQDITHKLLDLLKVYQTLANLNANESQLKATTTQANLVSKFLTFCNKDNILPQLPQYINKSQQLLASLNNNSDDLTKISLSIHKFLDTLITNHGHISASLLNNHSFTVGGNLASTPGKIIYQNALIELIQYRPTTNKVYVNPILFIPSWINKYYVLDLKPENSLVQWLIAQGFTVFMISWVNPNLTLAQKNWENYLLEGPIAALNIINQQIPYQVHMVGYCLGGTLLACVLAYLQQQNDPRILTATYLNTLLDFSQSNPLTTWFNNEQLTWLNNLVNNNKILDARLLDLFFIMLRPFDFLWQTFIDNYLLEPRKSSMDLLFWNADATNVSQKMANDLINNLYIKNSLFQANKLIINSIPIDLTKITTPIFAVASEKDHIIPWQSSYNSMYLQQSNITFILAKAGHIAGIINPPPNNKYGFFTTSYSYQPPEKWRQTADFQQTSWWPTWKQWLISKNTNQLASNKRDLSKYQHLVNAPGTYVQQKFLLKSAI